MLSDDLPLYFTINENVFRLLGGWVLAICLIQSFLNFVGLWSLLGEAAETLASFDLENVCVYVCVCVILQFQVYVHHDPTPIPQLKHYAVHTAY